MIRIVNFVIILVVIALGCLGCTSQDNPNSSIPAAEEAEIAVDEPVIEEADEPTEQTALTEEAEMIEDEPVIEETDEPDDQILPTEEAEIATDEATSEDNEVKMTTNCSESNDSYKTYYVRTDGDDENSGLANSAEEAFATISYAVSHLCGGDHLYIEDGVYVTKGILVENLHASPENPTIISALNTWGAKLNLADDTDMYTDGIRVVGSSYLQVIGFEVISNETGLGSGIDVREGSHHVTIKDNYVRDNGCNGISSRTSDYLIFESNVVRDNAKRSEWNCSGISIWHPIEHDQEPGYHIIIRKNVAFENECDLPFSPHGHDTPTDGNGIIVDDFRNTQGGGQEDGYFADVLVENNLSFNNGGRGIHVYEADNVTVRHNTTYHNLRILSKYNNGVGDLTLYNSNGSQVYNNLIVKNPDIFVQALRLFGNDGLNTKIYNNIVVGQKNFSNQTVFEDANQYKSRSDQAYPQFINPSVDVEFSSIADFRNYFGLLATSPAVNAGMNEAAAVDDLDGNARPLGGQVDIGCYETMP